jgi:hypothetical protein
MPSIPAYCEHCGYVFDPGAISVQGTGSVKLIGMTTNCPRCGKAARILDGTFDVVGSNLRVANAPETTRKIFEILGLAIRESVSGKADEEIIKQIEKISPELAKAAREFTFKSGSGIIMLLLFLLSFCQNNLKIDVHQEINWNQLVDQANVYVTGHDPYPGLSEPKESGKIKPLSRQQRRHLARQANKQQRKPSQP